jgi:hypothetical protein
VQALVDIVRRSSGREHPRMTLARLLMSNEKVRARAMEALSKVRVSGAPDPPKDPRGEPVPWDVAKAALRARSDGELNEIWKLCLERADSRENKHVFTRASAPTPIPDIRQAVPNCRNRRGTAAAVQVACTSRYMPDRQAGGPL